MDDMIRHLRNLELYVVLGQVSMQQDCKIRLEREEQHLGSISPLRLADDLVFVDNKIESGRRCVLLMSVGTHGKLIDLISLEPQCQTH